MARKRDLHIMISHKLIKNIFQVFGFILVKALKGQ